MNPASPQSDILTTEQVAQKLRVSVKTIYRKVGSGLLPCIKIGPRIWRFSNSRLDLWLERKER